MRPRLRDRGSCWLRLCRDRGGPGNLLRWRSRSDWLGCRRSAGWNWRIRWLRWLGPADGCRRGICASRKTRSGCLSFRRLAGGSCRRRGREPGPRCRLGRRSRCDGGQGSLVLGDDPLDGRDQHVFRVVVLLLLCIGSRHRASLGESQHTVHGGQNQTLRVQLSHLGFQRLDHVVLEVPERLHQPRVEGLVRAQLLPAGLEHPEHNLLQTLLVRNRALRCQPEAAVDDRHGHGLGSRRPLRQLLSDGRLKVSNMTDELWRDSRLEDKRVPVHSGRRPSGSCCLRRRHRDSRQAIRRAWHVMGRKTLPCRGLGNTRLRGGSRWRSRGIG